MSRGPCCARHSTCFIVPTKVLRAHGDLDGALLSERLRGHRAALRQLGHAAAGLSTGVERRTIYDAAHSTRLPGTLVRGEGQAATADTTVNAAYDSAGDTYDFYLKVLARNSIDGNGMRLDSTVHYGRAYNNAFWNGQQMVYGDGDGKLFVGFASAIDVVGHELTHGVTQYTVPGGLTYEDESGALNESISDVFGILVKQWKLKLGVTQSDWLIGAGIMGPAYGKALRSMKAPGTAWTGDDQPGDMTGYVQGGDVHTNSGIPNRAFYLAASAIGGYAWEKAGTIWYRALPMLHATATFKDAAKATTDTAGTLFGTAEATAVKNAWREVKVLSS